MALQFNLIVIKQKLLNYFIVNSASNFIVARRFSLAHQKRLRFIYYFDTFQNQYYLKTTNSVRQIQARIMSSGPNSPILRLIHTIAAVQMTSTEDKEHNFNTAVRLIDEAVLNDAKVICLPEAFDFLAKSKGDTVALAETLDGPLIERYKAKAKDSGVWLLLGGFHEKLQSEPDNTTPLLANSHIAINDEGEIVSVYRKTHLFNVVIPEHNINLQESDYIKPGEVIAEPISTPVGKIGLGICYDLRFPEFSLQLRAKGSDVVTYPSAFTVATGKAHWEILLRARAIETQCYVVAAAQVGHHNTKRASYGHSMIINGWGEIVAHASTDTEQVILAPIDLDELYSKRINMPVQKHRRFDLYGATAEYFIPDESTNECEYRFGQVTLQGKYLFLKSRFSFAMVNRKCVVPGHVLVVPKRCVPLSKDMTQIEMSDLFMLSQEVVKIVNKINNTDSATITIQDGPNAGQSIKHVHVHVMPRRPGDFKNNDDIYEDLASHDKGDNVEWRDYKEMEEEANAIRAHIQAHHFHILCT